MNTTMRLAMLAVLVASCGGVETAMMDVDAGDGGLGGSSGAAGTTGTGGTGGGCADGSEGCACYGNGTCDGGLACLSHLCVMASGGGTGGSAGAGVGGSTGAGRGGTTGLGNTSGTGNTTGTGNVTGTGGTGGAAGAGGCTGTNMLCFGSCVNTNTSNTHCGGCNQPCTGGQCTNGVCTATGPGGATGGRGGAGGSAAAWYCPGGTDVACITDQGIGHPCTARCAIGQDRRGTQPDGSVCTCFFHASATGNYTECQPDSYCGP